MSFKIITDSGSDLSAEMIAELDLGIAPLSVELDGRAYAEGEMTPKALYDHLRAGKLPKTSACIRCGGCVEVCPAGLHPFKIDQAFRAGKLDLCEALYATECIACGCWPTLFFPTTS